MVKKKHNKDKKLHNFDVVNDESDLSWQERADLVPEDEVERGSEIILDTLLEYLNRYFRGIVGNKRAKIRFVIEKKNVNMKLTMMARSRARRSYTTPLRKSVKISLLLTQLNEQALEIKWLCPAGTSCLQYIAPLAAKAAQNRER